MNLGLCSIVVVVASLSFRRVVVVVVSHRIVAPTSEIMASLRRRRRFASHRIVAPTSELSSYHGVVALSSLRRRRRRRFASHRIVAPTSEPSSYHRVIASSRRFASLVIQPLQHQPCRLQSHRCIVASSFMFMSSFTIASRSLACSLASYKHSQRRCTY